MRRSAAAIAAEIERLDERIEGIRFEQRRLATGRPDATDAELDALTNDELAVLYDAMSDGQQAAFDRYNVGADRLTAERDELVREQRDIPIRAALVASPFTEGPMSGAMGAMERNRRTMPTAIASPPRSQALRLIDGLRDVPAAAAERLARVVRTEPTPLHADYLVAVGDPIYATAWVALMSDPDRAAVELSEAERAALRNARQAHRNLAVGLGEWNGSNGWPVPLTVDPTLILTGDGATDPLRSLATVRTIVGKAITVTTADSVTASYGAEGSGVGEVTPAPEPVEVKAERGAAFLRLTFELFADLPNASGEIAKLLNDARTVLEGEKFAIGSGTNEPQGIVTGLDVFGGSPSTPDDLIAAQNDLGARWQANARWLANLAGINSIGQMVVEASTDYARILDDAGNLLRKPIAEVSFLGDDNVVYGDVKAGFVIVDRLGMAIEPTGPTFDKDTGRPDGYRGFLCIWRSGSKVVVPDALRLLAPGS
jgi:HK97 family phage major capsid protein